MNNERPLPKASTTAGLARALHNDDTPLYTAHEMRAYAELRSAEQRDAIAQLAGLYTQMMIGVVRDTASAKRYAEGVLAPAIEALK